MKVSKIWMFVSVFLIGAIFGIFITTKVFINNIPETTSITIGKMKVRGKNNEVSTDVVLQETDISNEKTKPKKIKKWRD